MFWFTILKISVHDQLTLLFSSLWWHMRAVQCWHISSFSWIQGSTRCMANTSLSFQNFLELLKIVFIQNWLNMWIQNLRYGGLTVFASIKAGRWESPGVDQGRVLTRTKKWPEKNSKCNGSDFKEHEILKILLVDKMYYWKLILRWFLYISIPVSPDLHSDYIINCYLGLIIDKSSNQ